MLQMETCIHGGPFKGKIQISFVAFKEMSLNNNKEILVMIDATKYKEGQTITGETITGQKKLDCIIGNQRTDIKLIALNQNHNMAVDDKHSVLYYMGGQTSDDICDEGHKR